MLVVKSIAHENIYKLSVEYFHEHFDLNFERCFNDFIKVINLLVCIIRKINY